MDSKSSSSRSETESEPLSPSALPSEAVLQMNDMGFWFVQTFPDVTSVVISPYAIANTLMILYQASTGATRDLLEKVTHYATLEQDMRALFRELSTELFNDPEGDQEFNLESIVLVGGLCNKDDDVAEYLADTLQSRIQDIPEELFRVECGSRLQSWIRHVSCGEINQVMNVDFYSQAPVICTTALYFHGRYDVLINPKRSRTATFRNLNEGLISVAMMQSRGMFGYLYSRQLRAQAVLVPYDGNLSLLLLLPAQPRNLGLLEKVVESRLVCWLLERMNNLFVDLMMPRFALQQATGLREFFTKLGLGSIFSTSGPGPDFSGLHGRPYVPMGNLFQVVRILMDEGGEGGLYQGECMFNCAALRPGGRQPIRFHAEHPFLFYVIHMKSKAVLLLGRVVRL
ncbi:intracellular coagulation inhibitor 1-like [Ornithodoros turicata]|uniref:intracellular coagulation inhibitor 1-like n=1 Tax=Ornithodoros turicata TaxID=34597 RepID=UPI00313919D4